MYSHTASHISDFRTLPETLWREWMGDNNAHGNCENAQTQNANGLWELIKYQDGTSIFLFHAKRFSSHKISFSHSHCSTNLWYASGCHLGLPSATNDGGLLHSDVTFICKNPKEPVTLSIQVIPGATLAIIQLPETLALEFTRYTETLKQNDLFQPFILGHTDKIHQLIKNILNHHYHPNLRKHIVYGKIYEVFDTILHKNALDTKDNDATLYHQNEDLSIVKKAENILRTHFCSPPSLEQLAKAIGTNRNKLSQSFKRVHGKTVFAFCLQYKMKVAKQMLCENVYSISQVAERVGYDYPGNFTCAYKRYFGELPKTAKRVYTA